MHKPSLTCLFLCLFILHTCDAGEEVSFLELVSKDEGRGKDLFQKVRGLGKIVGGYPATRDRYPYVATLVTNDGRLVCGGTLISPTFVLSAAHCSGYASKVYVGRYLLGDGTGSQTAYISKEYVYRKYDPRIDDGDYMLIQLSTPIQGVPFPMLADEGYTDGFDEQTLLTTIGFGTTSAGGSISNVLLEVGVEYVPSYICESAYNNYGYPITPRMICAGGLEDRDSCQGDSGGPLFVRGSDPHQDVHVGITSWGIGCADGYPGVYARTSSAKRWISRVLRRFGENPKIFQSSATS